MRTDSARDTRELDAAIIGAGFSGLYMLHKLRDDLGMNVRVFEAGQGVGGVWYWNRYPGARCDSDAFVYCYSFDKQLLQDWTWSGKYPEQPEILRYLEHVADRFDLLGDITFGTYVTRAEYDDTASRWTVTTGDGEVVSARFLIAGIGHLAISKYIPDFPGLDTFEGSWYHTGAWPHEDVDLRGKRVGVIGTGSSGMQSIPVIARQAAHLTVFQRTPQYSVPARHETADEEFWLEVKTDYDAIWQRAKNSAGGFPWQHNGKRALEVSEQERQETYERLWLDGGLKFAVGSYRDLSYNDAANATVSDFIRDKIRQVVEDPETREKLIPTHPFMSRRPIVDTDYFETYNRDNVTLVDVRAAPITEITSSGVRTADADHDLDVLVFATGFDAVTGPYFNIDIRGRDGATLTKNWESGPRAYLGLQTVDFPNLFMITGPGATLGNLPNTIEVHVEWIADCLDHMRRNGLTTIETTREAQEAWTDEVNTAAEASMFSRTDSWINGSNIPGKARAYVFYFGHFGKFRQRCAAVAESGYQGFELS
jgi:cation diffusion facilitator CzcD-associated flavoprotein CzcO